MLQNEKGGMYYPDVYDDNLKMFVGIPRPQYKKINENEIEDLKYLFQNALEENEILALANLMFLLDIRHGKGERFLFKIFFKYLCEERDNLEKIQAVIIISNMEFSDDKNTFDISNFNRWKEENQDIVLPNFIFWNMSKQIRGYPVLKDDDGAIMVNGYSKNFLKKLLKLKSYTPQEAMIQTLNEYIQILKENESLKDSYHQYCIKYEINEEEI